jgi:pimeloyl-ACP methyl ester carboxylesterase
MARLALAAALLVTAGVAACATTSSGSGGASTTSSAGGTADAGPTLPCEDGGLDIHALVAGSVQLPQDLGRVVACRPGRTLTQATLAADVVVSSRNVTPVGGLKEYLIQYISQAPRGTPRRITASLMVPDGVTGPFPLVAVNHGTTGLGTQCGITIDPYYLDYMAFPLVAAGYVTVATDYQDLGVDDGAHPYAVGLAAADSVLDAVRAARFFDGALRGGALLTDELFLLGHSQGGHAALFAQQHFDVAGMRLLGVIPIAPAFGILYGLGTSLANANDATNDLHVFYAMILYGHAAYHGLAADTWLSTDAAARLPAMAQSTCSAQFYRDVKAAWPTLGALFNPAFQAAAGTCAFDGTPCPNFLPWAQHLGDSIPGYFTSNVPVLMLQGGNDTVVFPISTACVQAALRANNTPADTCYYATLDHVTVSFDPFMDAMEWMDQRRQGLPVTAVCPRTLPQTCPGF